MYFLLEEMKMLRKQKWSLRKPLGECQCQESDESNGRMQSRAWSIQSTLDRSLTFSFTV